MAGLVTVALGTNAVRLLITTRALVRPSGGLTLRGVPAGQNRDSHRHVSQDGSVSWGGATSGTSAESHWARPSEGGDRGAARPA